MRAASAFVGFVAVVLCAAPATVLVGRHVAKQSDVDWTPVAVFGVVAAVGFVACRALRAATSRRYLAAAIASGKPGISPAFACTLLAWVLVAGAGGLAFGTLLVYQTADDPDPGSYRTSLTHYPLPILFLIAGLAVLGAAGYYSWDFRRRHEIPELKSRNIAVRAAETRRSGRWREP
jgi:bacteriorhodopsin